MLLGDILEDLPSKNEPCPMLLSSRFSGLRASDCKEVAGESMGSLVWDWSVGSIRSRKTAGVSSQIDTTS